jgi:1,4-alpha-glucan branching enzyme
MAYTTREHDGIVEVRFHLPQDLASRSVSVVGEFNGWSPDAAPMTMEGDQYVATAELEPGRTYRFKYLVDGQHWVNDHEADTYEPNEFGGDDSVIDLRLNGWSVPDQSDSPRSEAPDRISGPEG